jgi:hypothetical protein
MLVQTSSDVICPGCSVPDVTKSLNFNYHAGNPYCFVCALQDLNDSYKRALCPEYETELLKTKYFCMNVPFLLYFQIICNTIPACKHWTDWIVSGLKGPEMGSITGKQRMWIFCSFQNKSLIKVGTGR